MSGVLRRLVRVTSERSTGAEQAFELLELAERMVEARFRREHPDATERAVRAAVRAWYMDRPGAPDGDCPGRVITAFR